MSLFFVLSAYLITTLLHNERSKTGSVNIRYFYLRRILRIWPLYITFLLAVWGVGRLHGSSDFPSPALASFLLLAGNWYFIVHAVTGPAMPLWSISLEEQFYLAWPAWFRVISERTFIWTAWALIAISLLSILLLHEGLGQPYWLIWLNTIPELLFFALGSLLAMHSDRVFRLMMTQSRLLCCGLAFVCWLAGGFATVQSKHGSGWFLVLAYLLSATGCVLLFQAVWGCGGIPKTLLYLGKISYGLYVFHALGFDAAHRLLGWASLPRPWWLLGMMGFPITLALASVSYPLLEKPFLRLKRRFEIVASR